MSEQRLREISEILERKYNRPFKLKIEDPDLIGHELAYDPNTDEILMDKFIEDDFMLASIAHEVGHKLHVDELKKEGRFEIKEDMALEYECEAYKRGLEAAETLNVKGEFIRNWRRSWQPLCIPCECPAPGDDKLAGGKEIFSIGRIASDYTPQQFGGLMKAYIRTGKWRQS